MFLTSGFQTNPMTNSSIHNPMAERRTSDQQPLAGDVSVRVMYRTSEQDHSMPSRTHSVMTGKVRPALEGAFPMVTRPQSFVLRLTWLMIAAAVVAAVWVPAVSAQDQVLENEYYLFDPQNDPSGSVTDAQPVDVGVGGMGVVARAGHVVGPTVGRTESITYTDFMPYMFIEDTMIFGDMKMNLGNNGKFGGSAGLGIRQYFEDFDAVGGLLFAYDHDATRSANFEQFVIAHEWLSEYFDVRTNVYLPFGRTQAITNVILEPGSEQFTDMNITFQRRSFASSAMRGGEQMYTIPIPGELAQSVNLDATAGWYHYQAPGSKMTWGYKLRADADVFDRIGHMFVEFTQDNTFGKNIIFAADVNYWHDLDSRPRIGQSQYNRMASWVRRNRTAVSDDTSFLNAREVALKADGTPYLVFHVRRVPGSPNTPPEDGSIDRPFDLITEGIAAAGPGNIVFVHSNSVFDGNTLPAGTTPNLVLDDNQLVLGEGVTLTLPVLGLPQEITLPTATNPVGAIPLITNVTGDAITFGNNSRFAGFRITNVTDGAALVLNGSVAGRIDEVTVDGVTSLNPGADGIAFTNASGNFSISGLSISNTTGDAFRILGGNAAISVSKSQATRSPTTNQIINSSGFSVLVEDAAGSLFFRDMTITDTGGLGLAVRGTALGNSTASVTFDTASLTNTNPGAARAGLEILNHSSAVAFLRNLTIDGNNGIGIDINTLSPSGSLQVQGNTLVDNRNNIGIRMINFAEGAPIPGGGGVRQSSRATFQGAVTVNGQGLPNSAGVLFSSGAGVANFNGNLTVTGSGAEGILINNIPNTAATTGSFTVSGQTQIDTAFGTSFLVQDVEDPDFRIRTNGINVLNRFNTGVRVQNYAGLADFRGLTDIGNLNLVGQVGLDILNNSGTISFATAQVSDQVFPGPAVNVSGNRGLTPAALSTVTFGQLLVTNSVGATGVLITDNDAVFVNSGSVETIGARAVDVSNNDQHNLTFASVSATASDFGIRVVNSPGVFQVTGVPNTGPAQSSGGLITGMTTAGAFFQNTSIVRLAGQDYTANNVGIVADQLLATFQNQEAGFVADTLQVSGSVGDGMILRDVINTTVVNSIFDDNGRIATQSHLEWGATIGSFDINGTGVLVPVNYEVTIQNNEFRDRNGVPLNVVNNINGHGIYLHSGNTSFFAPAGNGITAANRLQLLFGPQDFTQAVLGNLVDLNRTGLNAVQVEWTGRLEASLNASNITLNGDDSIGYFVNGFATSDVVADGNRILGLGDRDTAVFMDFRGPANVEISNNGTRDAQGNFLAGTGFELQGFQSTGIDLRFTTAGNNVFIEDNLIDFQNLGFAGTGIRFRQIVGPSSVTINGNEINLLSIGATAFGVVFQNIQGTINLNGTVDNTVTGFSPSNFFIPSFREFVSPPQNAANNSPISGQIFINGTQFP